VKRCVVIPLTHWGRPAPAAGFRIGDVRTNDYDFISERAFDACNTYGVESISLAAVRQG
jgi:hypothetical protein